MGRGFQFEPQPRVLRLSEVALKSALQRQMEKKIGFSDLWGILQDRKRTSEQKVRDVARRLKLGLLKPPKKSSRHHQTPPSPEAAQWVDTVDIISLCLLNTERSSEPTLWKTEQLGLVQAELGFGS